MSENGTAELQEQNEYCVNENQEENVEENESGEKIHSRKKRSLIEVPYRTNLDANGNVAEEF